MMRCAKFFSFFCNDRRIPDVTCFPISSMPAKKKKKATKTKKRKTSTKKKSTKKRRM